MGSTKSMTGHLLGAAGARKPVCALALQRGIVHLPSISKHRIPNAISTGPNTAGTRKSRP